MTEEYNKLEEYANCVQDCLKNSVHDFQLAADTPVTVIYATAPIAYAKEQEHFGNGGNIGPLITFYQSGIEVPPEQMMGQWKRLPVQRSSGNYLLRAPVIATIKYTVTISALTEAEADLLCLQIMQSTPKNRPYYTKLNGQFVTIWSDEFNNVGSVDVGENKDKFSQREITLTIPRAYLDYDIKELNVGMITHEEGIDESAEDATEVAKLSNGAIVMSDGTIKNGKRIRNTTNGSDGFYHYNIVDDDGNVIGVFEDGKVKLRVNVLEDVK